MTLVMRGKNTDPDVFYGKFMEVLRAREWELTGSANQGLTGQEGTSSVSGVNDLKITMPVVGISGILRKEQEIWESTDKNLHDAFQDLNALMVINVPLISFSISFISYKDFSNILYIFIIVIHGLLTFHFYYYFLFIYFLKYFISRLVGQFFVDPADNISARGTLIV
jgi:hypothetical protein